MVIALTRSVIERKTIEYVQSHAFPVCISNSQVLDSIRPYRKRGRRDWFKTQIDTSYIRRWITHSLKTLGYAQTGAGNRWFIRTSVPDAFESVPAITITAKPLIYDGANISGTVISATG